MKKAILIAANAEIPNFDCIDDETELMNFWRKHQSGRAYRELFRIGGRGTKRATADLANYASNRATAIQCRRRGDINGALLYESICDRIYSSLPKIAIW